MLFHEATFTESEAVRAKQTLHSTAAQAARIAKDAQVKRLLVGHFSARYEDEKALLEEAQAIFPNTLAADEGLKSHSEKLKKTNPIKPNQRIVVLPNNDEPAHAMNNYNEKETILMLQDPSTQRKAFERIVKAYSEQLYCRYDASVVSHDDANDLLQNTFIKAWTNLDYFRGDAKLSTWLYRIAFNEMPELPEQAARRKPTIHRRCRCRPGKQAGK